MFASADEIASVALLVAGIAVLLRICWTDFFYLKIWNRDLLVLAGVTAAYLAVAWPDDLVLRLALGAILFTLSFVFWLFGSLGAGDVKLFGVVGCLIPPSQAILFVALILVFALAIILILRRADSLRYVPQLAGRRVLELAGTGRVPYGVPIALAGVALILTALPVHV
jgi:Flp pilus assembly protein protease CpaA